MTSNAPATTIAPTDVRYSDERADLLDTLAKHRFFLRFTARDLSDAEARQHTTASALSIGGLIKHVTATEAGWAGFLVEGAPALGNWDVSSWGEAEQIERAKEFQLQPDETLSEVLENYARVAARTDEFVASLPSLDVAYPLPEAPWFEPGAFWSARRAVLHIIAETAQHAGHADIIRESLDGAKTMG